MSSKISLAVPLRDVQEILGLSRHQILRRIEEGLYPLPKKNERNGRYTFTLIWLELAKIRESEIRAAQLKIEQIKAEALRKRLQRVGVLKEAFND